LAPPLKLSEYPTAHHSTVVIASDAKLWIMIVRVFERPTSPP
jgi:hypothetical protein